jgi:hypothetical protein
VTERFGPRTVISQLDKKLPCWVVFTADNTPAYTAHHRTEEAAKTFACHQAEGNGWEAFILVKHEACNHDIPGDADAILLRLDRSDEN